MQGQKTPEEPVDVPVIISLPHHNPRQISCFFPNCTELSNSNPALERHSQVHNNAEVIYRLIYKCKHCEFRGSSRAVLSHYGHKCRKTHPTEEPAAASQAGAMFECEHCKKTYSTPSGRGVHINLAHPVEKNQASQKNLPVKRMHWLETDLYIIAYAEVELAKTLGQKPTTQQFLEHLQAMEKLPNRELSIDIIKYVRQKPVYKVKLDNIHPGYPANLFQSDRELRKRAPREVSEPRVSLLEEGRQPAPNIPQGEPKTEGSSQREDRDRNIQQVSEPRVSLQEEGNLPESSIPQGEPKVEGPPPQVPRMPEEPDELQGLRLASEELVRTCIGNSAFAVAAQETIERKRSTDALLQDLIQMYGLTEKAKIIKKTRPKKRSRKVKGGPETTEYSRFQHLFKKNQKTLFQKILEGNVDESTQLDPSAAVEFWSSQYNPEPTGVNTDFRLAEVVPQVDNNIWTPITRQEVKSARDAQKGKASGPDGLDFHSLATVEIPALQVLYNIMMLAEDVPVSLKENITILLPKTNPPSSDPSKYRPITMASIILRVFHKILASRLSKAYAFHPSQRGFVTNADGCLESTMILSYLVSQYMKPVFLVLLDLRKAFDTVRWNSLFRRLQEERLPPGLIRYIKNVYEGSSTSLTIAKDVKIPFSQGVKQGDPLSPFLFNLLMDKILREMPSELGAPIGEAGPGQSRCPALAFADDLLLCSDTQAGLQHLLDKASSSLRSEGLVLNKEKCLSLCLNWDKKAKRKVVDNRTPLVVEGTEIRGCQVDDVFKYLGVNFHTNGKVQPNVGILKSDLDKLKRARLKSNQKIVLLRKFLIPKYAHSLTLGRISMRLLSEFDLAIRNFVKEVLRLPHFAADCQLYAPCSVGGLGIPSCLNQIPRILKGRLERSAASSTSPHFQALVGTARHRRLLCQLEKLVEKAKDFTDLANRTLSLPGWKQFGNDAAVNKWLWGESPGIRGKSYNNLVKLRGNLLPCKANSARGGKPAPCRFHCHTQTEKQVDRETLAHIINRCRKTHDSRTMRHNKILEEVGKTIEDKGYRLLREPHINTSNGLLKPDLIIDSGEKVFIVDVAVPYEKDWSIDFSYNRKVAKYDTSDVREFAKGWSNKDLEFGAIIVGARGAVCKKTAELWKQRLKLPLSKLHYLSYKALFNSFSIYKQFMSST